MLLIRFFIFSLLFFNYLDDTPKDKSIFIPPLKITELLSSNFGELRIDHFHSGLDIKTQGVTGKEVVAAADGYIYRISITPGGFGNALYIRHPSGYSTVYGHLDRFKPEIEKWVKARQYQKKSFTIALFPSKDEFPVKQGELIAYSGNSGGSGGPHLHFEIRKSDSEKPVNPLLFDLGIADNLSPVIEKLSIYPINRYTSINNQNSIKKIVVRGSHGNYYIPPENEITISGIAGFGIKAFDKMNDSPNRVAVYSIELLIDSTEVYKYVMHGFSFDESRYINCHIDYETFMKENIYIERAYVLPGDKLSLYQTTAGNGTINFNDDKIHRAVFIVTDAHNNKSTLSFNIKSQAGKSLHNNRNIENNIIVMPYDQSNRFTSENVMISIPEGALYDTLYFACKKEAPAKGMLSDIYFIHNKFTPVQKAFSIAIKPGSVIRGKESKMLIIQSDDDINKNALNSEWSGGYLTADAMSFGRFYVGIDTIPPVITASELTNGVNLEGRKEIRIRVKDDLSGIRSYEPLIDGKWALFEYDQKNNLLICNFDKDRIIPDSKHTLSLEVADNKDNVSIFECNFTW